MCKIRLRTCSAGRCFSGDTCSPPWQRVTCHGASLACPKLLLLFVVVVVTFVVVVVVVVVVIASAAAAVVVVFVRFGKIPER